MARLTKEERKVFDPSFLIDRQKREANIIKDLTIGGGKGGAPNRETPGWDKGWPPPAPLKANFLAPSGTGKTLSEEAYWNGLQTIMETTEAGSDEQNKRLNILMHQFQDQVSNPADKMKINPKVAMADKMYRVTDWDKKQNNEAWNQFINGNPSYFYKPVKGRA